MLGSKFTLKNQLMDFFKIAGCLLRHKNFATSFVIDLQKRDMKMREKHRSY